MRASAKIAEVHAGPPCYLGSFRSLRNVGYRCVVGVVQARHSSHVRLKLEGDDLLVKTRLQ